MYRALFATLAVIMGLILKSQGQPFDGNKIGQDGSEQSILELRELDYLQQQTEELKPSSSNALAMAVHKKFSIDGGKEADHCTEAK